MDRALVLFAHGARDPEWALPIRRVQAAVAAQAPGLQVEAAFLEFMAPTLSECIAQLAGTGVRHIVVLPMFIAQGGHLRRDVPLLLNDLRREHPEIDLELAPAVGENEAVIQAMARAAVALCGHS